MENKSEYKINYLTPGGVMNVYPFKAFKISNRAFTQFPHSHSYLQIWYVKSGNCIHWLNDIEYNLQAGDIFVLPPDVPHKVVANETKNIELIGCEFMEEFLLGEDKTGMYYEYIKPFMVDKDAVKPYFSLKGTAVKEVEKIFERMVDEYENKKPFFELGMRAEFLKLLAIIIREYNRVPDNSENINYNKHRKSISIALDYMKDHYKEKIYLDDICKIMLVSPTYFSCIFKQITGKTFVEQLNAIRIQKAKELMMDHNKTMGRIAMEVGFSDLAYFNRVFKKEVGVSPGKFRTFL